MKKLLLIVLLFAACKKDSDSLRPAATPPPANTVCQTCSVVVRKTPQPYNIQQVWEYSAFTSCNPDTVQDTVTTILPPDGHGHWWIVDTFTSCH